MIHPAIAAVARKDLQEVRQNRAAWMPIVIVPLIFVIILPLAMILIPTSMDISPEALASDSDLDFFIGNMPASMLREIEGMDEMQSIQVLMIGYLFAPFFLIFPLMFSTVIAAESFAGERERKTLEALLYTPITNRQLFLGKVLAAYIPSVAITWLSFLVYTVVVNTAGYGIFHRLWFPLPTWYPLIFWISPALGLLGISATVLISTRVQTFMGAYQLSSSLVVLVLAFIFGQISGVVYLSVPVGLVTGLVLWLASAGLTYMAARSFTRRTLMMGKTRMRDL